METLEKSRMCRLCGKQSGIAIDIFDKNESHVRKINAILPILVHEMDLLPKQMCHRCSYKLEEFYNFYVDCAKTDTELKNQLSWMRKENLEEKIVTPMVKMIPFKIKAEPDPINSENVLGQVDDNSLLFPESILQHSFESGMGPILSCSRCQCLCNRNVKINKTSPKSSKIDSDDEAHSSKVSNKSFINSELCKSKNDDNNYFKKDFIEDGNFKELQIKESLIMNLNKSDFSNSDNTCSNDSDQLKNRALRPRKSSIDYLGQKKKGIASNLKVKFNSKLDMLDPALVNPVEIKVAQGNSMHPSPIIKLEKVDDTMKSLRVQKNLEEFNRRIKALKCKKIKHKRENLRIQVLNKMRNFSSKELENTKSFRKEENEKVCVQTEEMFTLRKGSHKEANQNNKNLWSVKDANKRTVQANDNLNTKDLKAENNQAKKCLLKVTENKNQSQKKEESKRNESSLNNIENNGNNENLRFNLSDVVIKQEVINKITNTNETVGDEEKSGETNSCVDKHTFKHTVDRHPLCAVVKLEKDYTCNVDYPRIKIKRHLTVANSSKSEGCALETPSKQVCTIEKTASNKSLIKNDLIIKTITSKKVKNQKKRKKSNNKNKFEVVSKKDKQFRIVKNKITGSQKIHTDLKCFCEECDTCFRTKELYKLHPCYQK